MNEPQIVYPKNPLTSTTMILNLVGAPILWAVTYFGLGEVLTPDLQAQLAMLIVTGGMALANMIVRRYFTKSPLSFSAPLRQTPAMLLPPSAAVVVSTSPATSAEPAAVSLPIPVGTSTVMVMEPLAAPEPPAVFVSPPAVDTAAAEPKP